jgi:hypothetical protein
MTVKRSETAAVCLLGGLLFSTGVKAVVTDAKGDAYNVIVDRNVFGLKPQETNGPPPPPATPATEVKLAGITTILSTPRAILQWKQPGQPAATGKSAAPPGKEESFIMVEGQREGIIEVLEINSKANSVKIKNGGEPMLLTFDTHGVKLPNTPPSAVPAPGGLPVPPGGARPGIPTASVNPGAAGLNVPVVGNPNPIGGGGRGGGNLANSGSSSIPIRQLRGAPGTPTQNPPLTPEAQLILMEVERERTKPHVAAGVLPPIPPTVLTPANPEEQ